jgi:collagenase-like PrtC family protease
VESDIYFDLMDIKHILNKTTKEICISINKIMHEEDLKELEMALVTLNKLNISKIFFYDVAILNMCRNLNIKKELVIYQEHLNASYLTNRFYSNKCVKYSLITNDITKQEINEIAKYHNLMMVCYGYLPIFYSRRYLVSNYLKYINKENNSNIYYIKNKDDYYPIRQEDSGTCIYTKEPIDLINEVKDIDIKYIVLNSFLISNDEFLNVIDKYINQINDNNNHYLGFLNEKTVYKVKDNE